MTSSAIARTSYSFLTSCPALILCSSSRETKMTGRKGSMSHNLKIGSTASSNLNDLYPPHGSHTSLVLSSALAPTSSTQSSSSSARVARAASRRQRTKLSAPTPHWPTRARKFNEMAHFTGKSLVAIVNNSADVVTELVLPANSVTAFPSSSGFARFTGPNLDSFYFTCAWVPTLVRLFVHWYEWRAEDQVGIIHATLLRSFYMDDDDRLSDLRRAIHNIFDWGLPQNKRLSEAVVKKIVARSLKWGHTFRWLFLSDCRRCEVCFMVNLWWSVGDPDS